MSAEDLCEICEGEPVEDGCDQCGRLVCGSHFEDELRCCTGCLSDLPRPDQGGERDGYDATEGRRV